MKTSRYISFQGATENRRKHAFDISPPEFARINGFLNYEQTGALLTPVPAMTVTIPVHGDPPCLADWDTGHTYADWCTIGAHTVLVGADSETRRVMWNEAGDPDDWDNGGFNDMPGSGSMEYVVSLGGYAVIFDDEGIAQLALTGDATSPFTYTKAINGTVAQCHPEVVDNIAWFIDDLGDLCKTNGMDIQKVNGPFNLKRVSEFSWTPGDTLYIEYNGTYDRMIVQDGSTTTTRAYVDMKTGDYTTVVDTTESIHTGLINLLPLDVRCHIRSIKVKVNVASGTPTLLAKGREVTDSAWGWTSETAAMTSATKEVELTINAALEQPQLYLEVGSASGAVELHGFWVIYDQQGGVQ